MLSIIAFIIRNNLVAALNFLKGSCQRPSLEAVHKVQKQPFIDVFITRCSENICSKFPGEHPCRSVISINLLCYFIETTLQHRCSPVNFLNIFRTSFLKKTYGELLLKIFGKLFTWGNRGSYVFFLRSTLLYH